MAHVDEKVRDTIWDCVLRFALEVDVFENDTENWDEQLLLKSGR
jgi:hypothetical protein